MEGSNCSLQRRFKNCTSWFKLKIFLICARVANYDDASQCSMIHFMTSLYSKSMHLYIFKLNHLELLLLKLFIHLNIIIITIITYLSFFTLIFIYYLNYLVVRSMRRRVMSLQYFSKFPFPFLIQWKFDVINSSSYNINVWKKFIVKCQLLINIIMEAASHWPHSSVIGVRVQRLSADELGHSSSVL